MATEIERKFLVLDDTWRTGALSAKIIEQGYLNSDGKCSIRVRVEDDLANINIKSADIGVSRAEFEFPIPIAEAREILTLFCTDRRICKTRYLLPAPPHTWEIDVFEGTNKGLIIAEIELNSPQESFTKPPWLGAEVTSDPRYYNNNLTQNPYCAWDKSPPRGDVSA